uniref:Tankyrase 1-binding protein C-terminal domain-containing protein n=1 Tax=Poecilia mexicana TaxID=48701 RepID=A0A3B3WSH1_9TELE
MQYLGGKLSAAQLQVAGWVGSVRRSLQGALELVWGPLDERQEVEEEEDVDDKEEEEGGNGGGRFQRAMSPLRSFARRSRRSLRRFSARSRQSSQKRAAETRSPQVNSCITNDEDKLIQTLLHSEQDGISEQASGSDSPTVPDASSEDLDNTDSQREMDLDAVCENSAPLLDNSSQKSKAVLGRRLTRSRPSRSLRLESAEAATVQLSVFKDEKDNQSDSEEEPPESKPVYSSTQRVPMFPGLNPKDLLIGIKKKTGGVAAEAEERSAEDRREQETESQNKKAAPSPSQASGTPRVAPRLAGAKLVLPPALIKDGGHLRPTRRKQTTQQNGET